MGLEAPFCGPALLIVPEVINFVSIATPVASLFIKDIELAHIPEAVNKDS